MENAFPVFILKVILMIVRSFTWVVVKFIRPEKQEFRTWKAQLLIQFYVNFPVS
jgi:hypothetical protein